MQTSQLRSPVFLKGLTDRNTIRVLMQAYNAVLNNMTCPRAFRIYSVKQSAAI
jgi:hypothetical protein